MITALCLTRDDWAARQRLCRKKPNALLCQPRVRLRGGVDLTFVIGEAVRQRSHGLHAVITGCHRPTAGLLSGGLLSSACCLCYATGPPPQGSVAAASASSASAAASYAPTDGCEAFMSREHRLASLLLRQATGLAARGTSHQSL